MMGLLSGLKKKYDGWVTRKRRFEKLFGERVRQLADRAAPVAIPATIPPVDKRRPQ